ncbi:MAG: AbrB family transcriptional regulator [Deltaproteobacteria bacterium]|nr:AbrB family transcriptional regulator [Deltaproteobacteria bacterium]
MSGRLGATLGTYAIGAACGLAAWAAHLPLPWLLGPLFGTGIAAALGPARPVVPGSRQLGQAVVGSALGLYFTGEVLQAIGESLPWMVLASAAALATGMAGAGLMRKRAGLDPATAFYAGVPGGAADMAVFGERAGGDPSVIALAQGLRVAAVVSVLPLGLQAWGARGADLWAPQALPVTPGGLLGLAALGAAAALILGWVRFPNGWLLGPLLVSGLLTATGHAQSAVPRPLVDLAQLLMGCALGHRFERDLIRGARVLLPAILAATVQGMLLLGAFGALLALAWGRSVYTLLLATAPGGIAEMGLTARTLQLGVPLVTAFHVVRLISVLTLAQPVCRWWMRHFPGPRPALRGTTAPPGLPPAGVPERGGSGGASRKAGERSEPT